MKYLILERIMPYMVKPRQALNVHVRNYSSEDLKVAKFWDKFYTELNSLKKRNNKTQVHKYYDHVISLLESNKGIFNKFNNGIKLYESNNDKFNEFKDYSLNKEDLLIKLQKKIEAMDFNEDSIFKSSMMIFDQLTNNGKKLAKDYIKNKIYERQI